MPRKPSRSSGRAKRTKHPRKVTRIRGPKRATKRKVPLRRSALARKNVVARGPSRTRKIAAKPSQRRTTPKRKAVGKAPVQRLEPSIVPPADQEVNVPDPAEQAARWHAYEMLIHRIETIAGAPLEKIYESLDAAGMNGRGFSEIVEHVRNNFSISDVDAATVVQGYPGHSGQETEFRAFLRRRRQLSQGRMRGDQPWFA